MERLCLDTILVDLLKGKPEVVEKVKELEMKYELATTSISIFELFYGAFKIGRERNVLAVRELAKRIEVLNLSEKAAEEAGRIAAELERRGESVDFRDVLIAGIAVASDVALYTRNVRHFGRIDGLRLFEG